MKAYANYSAIDFAEDENFIKWVKSPEQYPDNTAFWLKWQIEHPEKLEEIQEGRSLILAVLSEMESADIESRQKVVWNRLRRSVVDLESFPMPRKKATYKYQMAAVFVFILTASAAVWWGATRDIDTLPLDKAQISFLKEINNSSQSKTIVLSDGSTIVLEPKSTLQYPEVFAENLREIHLTGQAFFDVAKDPGKQFIVYSDQLITKVTGTSFTIRAFQNEDNLVQVKTGKVSVFAQQDVNSNKMKTNSQREGVLLTPNQQVIFSSKEAQLVKSLVETPILLDPKFASNFHFKDTPLSDVFQILEEAYGIEIVFDKEVWDACSLNASLDDIPLYDKMRLICKGVNAKYELLDSRIIISGKGCK